MVTLSNTLSLPQNVDQLTSAINIVVSRASAAAIAKVEALGGSVTTRFYSPSSIKRVLRGDSHPTISLQTSPELISLTSDPTLVPSPILSALQTALASPDTPVEVKHEALSAVMKQVGEKYKYRLPDATSRKDIEYYRDPAHRGYLSAQVKEGESPSLFFKVPKEAAKDSSKNQTARKAAAKASAENRLF
jgi:large subunit ribosomal protein L15